MARLRNCITLLGVLTLSSITSARPGFVLRQAEDEDEPRQVLGYGPGKAELLQFHVNSDIQLRYARTTVETYVKNAASEAGEIMFSMKLPSEAFVSNFSMTLNDKEYVAEVAEKKAADKIYNNAVQQGQNAGLVSSDDRDVNLVSHNILI